MVTGFRPPVVSAQLRVNRVVATRLSSMKKDNNVCEIAIIDVLTGGHGYPARILNQLLSFNEPQCEIIESMVNLQGIYASQMLYQTVI